MNMRLLLLGLALGLLVLRSSVGYAETQEEVRSRLERGRERDRQDNLRHQETFEWQQKRKAEEYARTWKQYGNAFEVNILAWWKQSDGNWITYAKFPDDKSETNQLNTTSALENSTLRWARRSHGLAPPKRFDQSLDELVRQGVLSCNERLLAEDRPAQASGCSNSKASLIGISCSSLHVNKKLSFRTWGKWERPTPGSPEEELLIERCSNP